MTRPVTLFTGQWADLPLDELARKCGEWGFDGLELACWGDHFDVAEALRDPAYAPDRFEDRFVIAHLKDVALQEDGTTATPEFGTGVVAQQPYLEFLRARRPDLPLIREHLPFDHIPRAMRRVDDLRGAGAGA